MKPWLRRCAAGAVIRGRLLLCGGATRPRRARNPGLKTKPTFACPTGRCSAMKSSRRARTEPEGRRPVGRPGGTTEAGVEKNDRYVVSVSSLKKTDEIEKLVRKIRSPPAAQLACLPAGPRPRSHTPARSPAMRWWMARTPPSGGPGRRTRLAGDRRPPGRRAPAAKPISMCVCRRWASAVELAHSHACVDPAACTWRAAAARPAMVFLCNLKDVALPDPRG